MLVGRLDGCMIGRMVIVYLADSLVVGLHGIGWHSGGIARYLPQTGRLIYVCLVAYMT